MATNGWTLASQYLFGPSGEQMTELNTSTGGLAWAHTNVTANGSLFATFDNDNKGVHFTLTDWLGTKRVQTSYLGAWEETCQGLPFGELNCFGPASDATEHHFTGKERDTESGLDYFGARYYGSNMGRFMSPDWASKPEAVPYSSLSDPQTLNLYSYMRNNPLGGTDPDGHCGQQQGGAGPDCQKLPNNPVSQVSPATKAQINTAVTATSKPSGTDTKGGSHEEAGISYRVNGTQTQAPAVPGPGKDVTTAGPATSDPYKTANPANAKPGDVQADVSYHTHPSATATTTTTNAQGQTVQTTSSFVQPPSGVDIQNASPSPTINIVVGTGSKTVYVYTGAGCTCHESLKDFNKPQ